ncbi:MAG: hypothetical protein BGO01_20940 [Armatimonadetes bacterium 55-13]|nr:hypothetical protein [Armatimonadota bacterium]ODU54159.1 MAG: hypothetical protein ABT09_00045 [bacterium SCN 57-13]OJU64578.1 MAG: hypothetical protein BGO01_20940 [Armatimonadetes bacterium 55-13]
MRALKTILKVLAIFVGQIHFCHAAYVLPNGQECGICPTLAQTERHTEAQEIQASHGDCHDCCQLKSCDKDGVQKLAKVAPLVHLVIDLPVAPNFWLPIAFADQPQRPIFLETAPPTGPPATTPSRAPPFFA